MIAVVLPDAVWKDVEPGAEALVEKWTVAPGDRVAAGQVIGNAILVKANLEIVAPASGVVDAILVAPEQTFARGAPLARIREA